MKLCSLLQLVSNKNVRNREKTLSLLLMIALLKFQYFSFNKNSQRAGENREETNSREKSARVETRSNSRTPHIQQLELWPAFPEFLFLNDRGRKSLALIHQCKQIGAVWFYVKHVVLRTKWSSWWSFHSFVHWMCSFTEFYLLVFESVQVLWT